MENMASFCGESCVNCQERACGKCAGCKVESGAAYSGSCPVKACAERKELISCGVCSQKSYCAILRECSRQREERHGSAARKKTLGMGANSGGSSYFKVLFILSIVNIVLTILDVSALNAVCGMIYGIVLIRMSGMLKRFRVSGILLVAEVVISVAMLLLTLAIPVMLPAMLSNGSIKTLEVILGCVLAATFVEIALSSIAYLIEMFGYSKLLMEMKYYDLAAKWRYLAIGNLVLNAVAGIMAAVAENEYILLIPAIGLWVVNGLKCYYLYIMDKIMRTAVAEEAE